ncbi:MAG: DNA helicase PcrA [Armatimonadota bacterium]|nr:DNA helicase PcrA [Armatimonadota bacterium]MDR5702217.1 DNA helicase PcrA [Armatimonadota bacterium]
MEIAELLADLNPPQREAVTYTGGPLLILAGAGSGKTRVLAYRAAYLIRWLQVSPHRILAVTFTNKAAGEMRERIDRLLGKAVSEHMWIGTFHAIASRLLRRHGDRIGLDRHFVIYDEGDQLALMRKVLSDLNLEERRYPPQAMLAAIGKAKNEGIDHIQYALQAQTFYEEVVARVYRAYQAALGERHAVDFDDLLLFTIQLFQEHPDVLAEYQERFLHVLVDEYQDTNHAQYLIVHMLAGKHRNLCVVGDDDQSIYQFRGADPRNILEFERDYPDAKIIKLEQNYRSTQRILEGAQGVIHHNPHRHPKRLWTENPPGKPLVLFEAYDGHEEAQFVAEEIKRLLEEGRSYRDIVVLYRTNAQSRLFEEHFLRAGIPYQIVGAVRFYERKEIKDILAYLRLLLNPYDTVSLRRIINVPRRGIGEVTLGRLEALAQEEGISLLDAMARATGTGSPGRSLEIPPHILRSLGEFVNLIAELRKLATQVSAADLIQEALARTGYASSLEEEGTEEAASRLENIQELINVAREFEAATGEEGLEAFLQHMSLIADIDTWKAESDRVTLMTLHSAKGLEFPVVFIVGMEEGLFPHARAVEAEGGLEEERRLCYVGMTRAKELLYLTYAQHRASYGEVRPRLPSRFLSEIPPHLLIRGVEAGWKPSPARAPDNRAIPLQPGDRIRHGRFGEGIVLDVEGEGANAIATIRFSEGVKRLALGYARLEKL